MILHLNWRLLFLLPYEPLLVSNPMLSAWGTARSNKSSVFWNLVVWWTRQQTIDSDKVSVLREDSGQSHHSSRKG